MDLSDMTMGGEAADQTTRLDRRRGAMVGASFGTGGTHLLKTFRKLAVSSHVQESGGRAFVIGRQSAGPTAAPAAKSAALGKAATHNTKQIVHRAANAAAAGAAFAVAAHAAPALPLLQVARVTKLQRMGRRRVRPTLPPHALSDPDGHQLPPPHHWAAMATAGRFYGHGAQPGPLKPPLHRPENSGRAASPAERAQGHPLWPALAPSLTKEVETTLDSPLASLTYERFGRNAVGWRLNGDRKGQARTASTIRARGPREAAAAAAAAPTPVGLDLVEQWAASSAAAAASATVAAAVAAPAGGKIEQPPSVAKGKLGKAVALLGTGKQINTGGGGGGGGGGLVIKSSHRAALRGGSGVEPDLSSDLGAKLGALRRQCSSWGSSTRTWSGGCTPTQPRPTASRFSPGGFCDLLSAVKIVLCQLVNYVCV